MLYRSVFVILLWFTQGCGLLDIERANSKQIVGSIYVVNSNLPEDSGFYLVFRTEKRDKPLLSDNDYIDNIQGNNDILLIKARNTNREIFYILYHNNGTTIIQKEEISEIEYGIQLKHLNIEYVFNG